MNELIYAILLSYYTEKTNDNFNLFNYVIASSFTLRNKNE